MRFSKNLIKKLCNSFQVTKMCNLIDKAALFENHLIFDHLRSMSNAYQ